MSVLVGGAAGEVVRLEQRSGREDEQGNGVISQGPRGEGVVTSLLALVSSAEPRAFFICSFFPFVQQLFNEHLLHTGDAANKTDKNPCPRGVHMPPLGQTIKKQNIDVCVKEIQQCQRRRQEGLFQEIRPPSTKKLNLCVDSSSGQLQSPQGKGVGGGSLMLPSPGSEMVKGMNPGSLAIISLSRPLPIPQASFIHSFNMFVEAGPVLSADQ